MLKFSRLPSWASEASLRTTFWPRFWMAWPLPASSRREVHLTEPVISLTRYSAGMRHVSGMELRNSVMFLCAAGFALPAWPDDKLCVCSANRLPGRKNSRTFSHCLLNHIPDWIATLWGCHKKTQIPLNDPKPPASHSWHIFVSKQSLFSQSKRLKVFRNFYLLIFFGN